MLNRKDFIEALVWRLRLHTKTPEKTRLMTFNTLPLDNDLVFEGFSLRDVICPKVPTTGREAEMAFDAFLWPLMEGGEGDPYKDLATASSQELVDFTERFGGWEEQTVRLLFALSNTPGATLEYDDKSCLVTHDCQTFGIRDGVVASRFCSGLRVEINPFQILMEQKVICTRDVYFCKLYREGVKKGKNAMEALVALYMSNPKMRFRVIADRLPRVLPTDSVVQGWVNSLLVDEDPVLKLYMKTVPKWMTAAEFAKVVCPAEKRSFDPPLVTLHRYANSLYDHFIKATSNAPRKRSTAVVSACS